MYENCFDKPPYFIFFRVLLLFLVQNLSRPLDDSFAQLEALHHPGATALWCMLNMWSLPSPTQWVASHLPELPKVTHFRNESAISNAGGDIHPPISSGSFLPDFCQRWQPLGRWMGRSIDDVDLPQVSLPKEEKSGDKAGRCSAGVWTV